MPQPKYEALHSDGGITWHRKQPKGPFSLERMSETGRMAKTKAALTRKAFGPLYAVFRRFKPVASLGGIIHISRDSEVREVLHRTNDFRAPFGPEMRALGEGPTFLLGLDGEDHAKSHAILARVVLARDAEMMADMSREFSAALLANHPGRIDVINDLIKRVPAEICIRYFGLNCQDADSFADWTLAISALLFGDPMGDETVRELAFQARDKMSALFDDAIARIRKDVLQPADTIEAADTLVHRLLIAQRSEGFDDTELRAILMGMASGFIPTNSIAASNMLSVILDQPEALARARDAARNDDADLMRKVILEAGRLKPTLSPGQWRYCPHETTIDVDGKEHTIPAGSTLLVSTMSAMRDRRVWEDAGEFRLDRTNQDGSWQEPDLLFGLGPHVCIGKHMAIAQISALFGELFKLANLRTANGKAGKVQYLSLFPRNLVMEYTTPAAQQSMYLVIVPVTDGIEQSCLEKKIGLLGRPANPAIRAALDASDMLHFASIVAIESSRGLDLIFELNCDGSPQESLRKLVEAIGPEIEDLLDHTDWTRGSPVYEFLLDHKVELHGKAWGATGLDYNGLGEFPVSRVKREALFADFAGRAMRDFIANETASGSHPMLAISHMRRILRQDPVLRATGTPDQIALMDEAKRERFDGFHLATPSMRLALTSFDDPGSHGAAAIRFLGSKDGRIIVWPLTLLWAALTAAAWLSLSGPALSKLILAPLIGVLGSALVMAALLAVFLVMVRRAEKRDKPFEKRASLEKMRSILESEDIPGYAQNHVFVTSKLKPGKFRLFLHAFGLWADKMAIVHRFRPGLINGMGTIHYARWYRIPGSDRAAFYSNFDGSWESYLEDFIARVSWGQSAAWSNWEGFPKTEFLFNEGAQNSDQFKNYTRTVQRIAPFWYSRFPELTAKQIRANGVIRTGAGLATTSTEAKEWLRHFGSMPRHDNLVEIDEVQGLVFRGMKRLPYSACMAITLPDDSAKLGEWLCWLRGKPMEIDGLMPGGAPDQIAALLREQVLDQVPRAEGKSDQYALAQSMTITFGDRPLLGSRKAHPDDAGRAMSHAAFIGISAAGMAKFTAHNPYAETIDEGLSYAFRMGMGGRGEILGDPKAEDRKWYWDDDVRSGSPTEAVLMLYASDPASLERMVTIHWALLANHGGKVRTQLDCAPAWQDKERIDFEHFGFRDGISQPAMRGVGRSTRGLPERDVMEPGEFIIGYPNNTGYFPMSPTLPPEGDVAGALPVTGADDPSRFPDFGSPGMADAERDLGRNGTYIVLRELAQDVSGFHNFAEDAATKLNEGGFRDLYKIVGQRPDADWVKAKMMGRWQDGRPLIGNPVNHDPEASQDIEERENDFNFGDDDPQGLACPFGSHIRRTNPRDSKHPGDPREAAISNRHRLLRRGRPYVRKDTGEKGLLFASIGTDIERQFEFVQQFWSNAPAFHGLDNEPDPVIGSDSRCTTTGQPRPRYFSIPTAVGPVRIEGLQNFVETKGGGYFFMPSRSALSWLSEAALYQAPAPDAGQPHTPPTNNETTP